MPKTGFKCGGCKQPVAPNKRIESRLSESPPYVSPCCFVEVIEDLDAQSNSHAQVAVATTSRS